MLRRLRLRLLLRSLSSREVVAGEIPESVSFSFPLEAGVAVIALAGVFVLLMSGLGVVGAYRARLSASASSNLLCFRALARWRASDAFVCRYVGVEGTVPRASLGLGRVGGEAVRRVGAAGGSRQMIGRIGDFGSRAPESARRFACRWLLESLRGLGVTGAGGVGGRLRLRPSFILLANRGSSGLALSARL